MKILEINIIKSSLPLKEPFTTALRSVESIDEVILILKTDTLTAYGSAPATLAVTGDDVAKISFEIETIIKPQFLLEELLDYERTFTKLSQLDLCSSAKACMDIALHDLFSKQAKLPLYRYLGGKKRPLQTLYTISINTPEKMLAQAQKVFNQGFYKLKIKLNNDNLLNIRRVETLHQALPKAELFLDINQALTLTQTQELIKALKHIPITLLEQPLLASQEEEMKQLTLESNIPILADESVFTLEDAKRCIEQKSADFINIKLMKCGGIYEAKKILELCQKHNILCMMGCMLESGISVTAALHLTYAYKNVIFTDLDGPTLASKQMIEGGIIYKSMSLSCHDGDGLGLTY
jgi:L-Ala-D/L-Glu epimerase